MRGDIAAMADDEADARWRTWRAQGAEGDRWRTMVMGSVSAVIVIVLTIWLLALIVV